MKIIIKRILAYAINKIIMVVIVYLLFGFIMHRVDFLRNYLVDIPGIQSAGLTWLGYIFCIVFLPYSVSYINTYSNILEKRLLEIIPISLIVICYIFADTILSYIFQGDLGKRMIGLRIYSISGKKANILQLFLRSTIKYISITIFPILLVLPLFNKKRMGLYDVISRTIVKEHIDMDNVNC